MTGGKARPAAGTLRNGSPGAALASVCEHSPRTRHGAEHRALRQEPDDMGSGTIRLSVASPAPEVSQLDRVRGWWGRGQDMTPLVCSSSFLSLILGSSTRAGPRGRPRAAPAGGSWKGGQVRSWRNPSSDALNLEGPSEAPGALFHQKLDAQIHLESYCLRISRAENSGSGCRNAP